MSTDADEPPRPDGRRGKGSGGPAPSRGATGQAMPHSLGPELECGVDLIEIDRIEAAVNRWGQRILHRVWTDRELAYCRGRAPQLASRFAGKEAVSKTLGTGIRDIVWREIEILPDRRGKPLLFLHGKARERAEHLGLTYWAISLTHSRNMACAMVVATSLKDDH